MNKGHNVASELPEDPAFSHLGLLYQGFLSVAEFRDPQTGLHLERMALFSRLLADAAAGPAEYALAAKEAWREILFRAAPLHDIGKIATPDRILLKPGKLTPTEFEVMKAHTTLGKGLLEGMSRRLRDPVPPVISMGILVATYHHERWDGLGYPEGLRGDAIPLAARIVALADVYDAITSPRVYRAGWHTHDEAIAFVQSQRGKMFDPRLVDAFHSIHEAVRAEARRLADPVPTPEGGKGFAPCPELPATILVVDDDLTICELLEEYLTSLGYQVKAASGVSEARKLLAENTFDLVTLDINMPGESGLVLLDELASMPDTMIIMMTALTDIHIGVGALKKGAYDYLIKPVNLDELALAVSRALRHRELELESRAYLARLELTVAYRTRELAGQVRALEAELAQQRRDSSLPSIAQNDATAQGGASS
ncbi:MAG: HD domain-containing phosphohydrolase [Anaerolineae bacterium]